MNGLALQSALIAKSAPLPVVILTAHGDVASTRAALRAGALDYLEKPFDPDVLLDVVRNAMRIDAQRSAASAERSESYERLGRLTQREREVMVLLSRGKGYREIGEQLGISARTVEVYKARVMAKLQCGSVAELVRYALKSQSECGEKQ
jgi:FixJ family two-component response regulator